MSIHHTHREVDTFYKAKQFEVNRLAACRVRSRYLFERIDVYLADCSDVALKWAWDDLDEVLYLLKHAGYTNVVTKEPKGYKVTDEMKQQAINYPITNLVSFVHGRGTAWCHDDKRPSLVWNKKANKVWCPVCNRQWSSYEVLIDRDGYKYGDAVRELC